MLSSGFQVTELDKIIQYMISEPGALELTDREKEIFRRIEYAYDHLHEYSDLELKNMLIKKYQVSKSTAYNDINTAYLVHGKTGKLRRDVEMYFLTQRGRIAIRNAFESGNVNQQIKAIEAHAKILALYEKEDAVDWSKIQPSNYYLVINQNMGTEEKTLKIDLNKVHEFSAEDFALLQQRLIDNYSDETVKLLESYGTTEAG